MNRIRRREFTKIGCKVMVGAVTGTLIFKPLVNKSSAAENLSDGKEDDWNNHYWGFVVDTEKCIGCGRCVFACKLENHVPFDEPWYRTWVERYRIKHDDKEVIDSPSGGIDGFDDNIPPEEKKWLFMSPNCVIIAIIHPVFRYVQ